MIYCNDPSWPFFQTLQTLSYSPEAPLMNRSLGFWRCWGQPEHIGPIMAVAHTNREILRQGGLPLKKAPDKPSLIDSRDKIAFIRALFTSGAWPTALTYLEEEKELKAYFPLWHLYLSHLLDVKKNIEKLPSLEENTEHVPRLLLHFLFIKDPVLQISRIENFIDQLKIDEWEKNLWSLRLKLVINRYEDNTQDLFTHIKQIPSHEKLEIQTLIEEHTRRALEHLYQKEKGEDKEAIASWILKIDPNCARAHLMMAQTLLQKGQKKEAIPFLYEAIYKGVMERPIAHFLLSKISFSSYHLSQAKQSADYRKDQNEHICLKNLSPSHVYTASDPLKELFLSNVVFRRFSSYVVPNHESKEKQPLCALIPSINWNIFQKNPDPYFETSSLQRSLVSSFRKELFYQGRGWRWCSYTDFSEAKRWFSLIHDEEKLFYLIKQPFTDIKKRVYFARYLASLGFFKEASDLLKISSGKDQLDIFFLKTTALWIEHFFIKKPISSFLDKLEAHYHLLPDSPEALRLKNTTIILGVVLSAKDRDISMTKKWRERGQYVLSLIQNSDFFANKDKILIDSRLHRAMCYLPFLEGNNTLLLLEQTHLLQQARLLKDHLKPSDEIIYKDNLFAALETSARILEHLKEKELALSYMKEIVETIDPLDAKAWLQVGELLNKSNQKEEALKAFLSAASVGAPHAQMAYYMAGQIAEQLNDKDMAQHCYMQSLYAFPGGISPLNKMRKLNPPTFLKEWLSQFKIYGER